ncbi:MAG: DUF1343 domain-containing protein [Flavobacteriaceae bacterium]
MLKNTYFFLVSLVLLGLVSCNELSSKNSVVKTNSKKINTKSIEVGASQLNDYLSLLKNKKVAVVANQTSVIFKKDTTFTHLVDSLLSLGINIKKVFAPEHGFRGQADAGEHVANGIDSKTGLPIISLYGKNRKPSQNQLKGIDIVVFDIQDVGVRFYTYISTLHYVMEACAEAGIAVIVLDRPNPNGHYVDGPVLEPAYKSFVGMHTVPLVYGMTIGEYAHMINGENWLTNGLKCDLKVIKLKNYTHKSKYYLPIKPSPNLPNAKAVNLYASLALFEGTIISCGRGTETQFQIFGAPSLPASKYTYTFTPHSNFGSKYPKFKDVLCYGKDLRNSKYLSAFNLEWLLSAYKNSPDKKHFFNKFFTKLAGTKKLEQQIKQGLTEKAIKKTWQKDLKKFRKVRKQYLLYK